MELVVTGKLSSVLQICCLQTNKQVKGTTSSRLSSLGFSLLSCCCLPPTLLPQFFPFGNNTTLSMAPRKSAHPTFIASCLCPPRWPSWRWASLMKLVRTGPLRVGWLRPHDMPSSSPARGTHRAWCWQLTAQQSWVLSSRPTTAAPTWADRWSEMAHLTQQPRRFVP